MAGSAIGEVIFDIIGALGEGGAADAAVGAGAAALGGADAAGAFSGGAGDATATDIPAPITPTDAGTVSGLASTNSAGVGDTTASIPPPTTTGVAGAAPSSGAMLPEQTVTASSLAGTGGSGIGGLLPAAGVLGAAAGGGGSGVPGAAPSGLAGQTGPLMANNDLAPGAVTDTGPTLNTGGSQFLSSDDTGPSLQNLSPDVAQSLGIDPIDTSNIGGYGGQIDTSSLDQSLDPDTSAPAGSGGGFGSSIENWLSSPKNDATAGLLGLSLKSALTKPKLPGADSTAEALAATNAKTASSVINSGGTATPEWASQKASIDAGINQQIQQQTQAIMQAAASSGEGTQNSGIVQQQIQTMTQNLNAQRQQQYLQAQQQNVNAAISELAGGDQVLTTVGNTQLAQSEEAQQLAAQTGELALLLQSGGSVKLPGQGQGVSAAT